MIPCFNSRTRKGCDAFADCIIPRLLRFNSRTRKGCDPVRSLARQLKTVSIHAPVKGATCRRFDSEAAFRFNSRTRKGCDINK